MNNYDIPPKRKNSDKDDEPTVKGITIPCNAISTLVAAIISGLFLIIVALLPLGKDNQPLALDVLQQVFIFDDDLDVGTQVAMTLTALATSQPTSNSTNAPTATINPTRTQLPPSTTLPTDEVTPIPSLLPSLTPSLDLGENTSRDDCPSGFTVDGITETELSTLIDIYTSVGSLIGGLNNCFDTYPHKGDDWGIDGITIEGKAVFWTDLGDANIQLPEGVERVLTDGGHGVFLVESGFNYDIPSTSSGGRFLRVVSSASTQQISFTVDAKQPWQSTGIEVEIGNSIDILYEEGEWRGSAEGNFTLPGDGGGNDNVPSFQCMPVEQKETGLGGLIGKVGISGEPFIVNTEYSGISETAGILYLRMNDCDNWLFDNSGSVTVSIKVR